MVPPAIPSNESERLAALRSYDVLDTTYEVAFDNIVELAATLTGSPISMVSLVDAERQWFKSRVGMEVSETPRDQAFCAHAILEPGEAFVVADALLDPRFADNPLVKGADKIRFYAGMALVNPEGMALGALCVMDRKPREISSEHLRMLRQLADTVMTTLELRRAMAKVHQLALIDSLTGLPNRPALLNAVGKAISHQRRHGGRFSLLYLDLDGFKLLNDRLGHAAGDAALREVATTLAASARAEDTAARIGGDEFALLLDGDDVESEVVAEKFRAAVKARMDIFGWGITASIGSVTFLSAPESVDEALSAADRRMYQAKAAGKNRLVHADVGCGARMTLHEMMTVETC